MKGRASSLALMSSGPDFPPASGADEPEWVASVSHPCCHMTGLLCSPYWDWLTHTSVNGVDSIVLTMKDIEHALPSVAADGRQGLLSHSSDLRVSSSPCLTS